MKWTKFEISKVYTIRLWGYRDEKFCVCARQNLSSSQKAIFIIPLLEVRCNLLYFAPMPRVIFSAHFFHFQVVPHICDGKFYNLLFLEIIESWERLNEFQKWVAFTCVWGRTVSRCKSDRKFILGTVRVI